MPHGLPDYGVTAGRVNTFASLDMGELAVRLGGISRYDRLGDVIFLETFEGDLGAWEATMSGAGASVDVVADHKVSGGFSCKLVAGSDAARHATIMARLPVPYSTRYGFEWMWTMDANMDWARMYLQIYTGAYELRAGLRYTPSTGQNAYYALGGSWVDFGDPVTPLFSDYNFISTKLTIDIAALKYKRMLAPPDTYDIDGSNIDVRVDAATQPHMAISGRIQGAPGTNAVSYLDNFIVTCNDL